MNDNTAVMAAYGLQKAYGACRALDGVNMQVRRGDVYGLVGRNGAGKTTLMRMVTGQSEPSGGETRARWSCSAHRGRTCDPSDAALGP